MKLLLAVGVIFLCATVWRGRKAMLPRQTAWRHSLSEDYEVRNWSKKFGVTADELKAAVKAVGSSAKDVEAYLKKSKAS